MALVRRAPVTVGLLCVIFLVWVLEGGLLAGGGNVSISRAVVLGAQVTPYVLGGQWWRVVTAIFIHWSWIHILANGWSLYVMGSLIEPVWGPWRFLVIFFLGGILGGLVSLVILPVTAVSAGASGAIFGLLGAAVVLALYAQPGGRRSLLTWIIMIVVINLGYDITNPSIDIWAHVGGFVGGALSAVAVGLPVRKWATGNGVAAALLFVLIVVLVAKG